MDHSLGLLQKHPRPPQTFLLRAAEPIRYWRPTRPKKDYSHAHDSTRPERNPIGRERNTILPAEDARSRRPCWPSMRRSGSQILRRGRGTHKSWKAGWPQRSLLRPVLQVSPGNIHGNKRQEDDSVEGLSRAHSGLRSPPDIGVRELLSPAGKAPALHIHVRRSVRDKDRLRDVRDAACRFLHRENRSMEIARATHRQVCWRFPRCPRR